MFEGDQKFYDTTEAALLASGRDFFSDYHTLLPKNDGDVRSVPISELIEEGYVEKGSSDDENEETRNKIINNDGESCDGTVYVKRLGNREYNYCVVLKCNEKQKINTCTGGEEEVEDREYEILHKDTINIRQCSTYNEMLSGVEEIYKHLKKENLEHLMNQINRISFDNYYEDYSTSRLLEG